MPVDLSGIFVIGVSTDALFDLSDAKKAFESGGKRAYINHQLKHEDEILKPGTGFDLVRAILNLNAKARRKADVVWVGREFPEASLRILNSVRHYNLKISRVVMSGGEPPACYLSAFNVGLFLSTNISDVQEAANASVPAALVFPTPASIADPREGIRIAFDADAVVFSDEAEKVYQEKGLDAFNEHELRNARRPLPPGPFAHVLRAVSFLQADTSFDKPPVTIAVVTARGFSTYERVVRTFRSWNINVDKSFCMDGADKTQVLKAFRPHIFFDDQDIHCGRAAHVVPTAKVLALSKPPAPAKRN